MTQPNPELWSRFIEAVAKGQVKGLSIRNDHGTNAADTGVARAMISPPR